MSKIEVVVKEVIQPKYINAAQRVVSYVQAVNSVKQYKYKDKVDKALNVTQGVLAVLSLFTSKRK